MEIITKFNLGDSVWVIGDKQVNRKVNCITCQCTGKVQIGGEEFTCPKCNGHSQHEEWAGRKWVILTTGIVGKIEANRWQDRYKDEDYHQDIVNYMLNSTGVGSGSNWKEQDLLPSRESAQAECDRRNASVNFEDDKIAAEALA